MEEGAALVRRCIRVAGNRLHCELQPICRKGPTSAGEIFAPLRLHEQGESWSRCLSFSRRSWDRLAYFVGHFTRPTDVGEDLAFCIVAKAAGFGIQVNTAARAGHILAEPLVVDESNAGPPFGGD